MRYRIVLKPGYYIRHNVQKKGLFGWRDVFGGKITECQQYLSNLISHKDKNTIIREVDI